MGHGVGLDGGRGGSVPLPSTCLSLHCGLNPAGGTRNPAHRRGTYCTSVTLHLLVHSIVTTSLWGGSTRPCFVSKETETQSSHLAQGSRQACSWDIFKPRSPWLLSPVTVYALVGLGGHGESSPQSSWSYRVPEGGVGTALKMTTRREWQGGNGRGNLHQGWPAQVSASALPPTLCWPHISSKPVSPSVVLGPKACLPGFCEGYL